MKNYPIIIMAMIIQALSGICRADANPYVRNIDIVRYNVFDEELNQRYGFVFKIANKLHVLTKDKVIRQELLLQPGDTLSQDDLAQSLRNIRALAFIGDADAEIVNAAPDSVDLVITTEDLWTTTAGLASEGGGGLYNFTAYADEKNIAGLGIGVETEATVTSDDNNGYSLALYYDRFLGTRNGVNVSYKDYKFEDDLYLLVYRPYYAVDTRFSYSIKIDQQRSIPRMFYQGEEIYRYKRDYDYLGVSGGLAFGQFTRFQPSLQYIYSGYDYGEYSGYPDIITLPDDEKFSGPGFGLKLYTHRFINGRFLDEFGTIEDLTEHATISISTVWSGPTFGGDYEAALVALSTGFFWRPYNDFYTGFSNTHSCYYTGGYSRERIVNSTGVIAYFKPTEYQLLALRSTAQLAYRQRPNYQLVLGGDNGLRGYPDRYFTGTKLSLTNFEYRLYTPIEILTVGLGAAAFCDIGYVWDDDQRVRLADLKSDVGLGLRLGLTKSSTSRTVRLDLARALNENNWYISFGTENIFSLADFQ